MQVSVLSLAVVALIVGAPVSRGAPIPDVVASPGARPSAPSRDEASMKAIRSQTHALNSRIYADVGTELGLTRDEANRLIDLLTDQQVDRLKGGRDSADSVAQAIVDLLGGAHAEALLEYQKTLPERYELLTIAGQLENAGVALTAEQSRRLLAVLAYERPSTPQESAKTLNDWQTEHDERVATQARAILSSSQWTVFESFQRELKTQRERLNTPHSMPLEPDAAVNYTDAAVDPRPH